MSKQSEKVIHTALIENAYIQLSKRITIWEAKDILKRLRMVVSDREIKRFCDVAFQEYNLERCHKLWIPMPDIIQWILNSTDVELSMLEDKYGEF